VASASHLGTGAFVLSQNSSSLSSSSSPTSFVDARLCHTSEGGRLAPPRCLRLLHYYLGAASMYYLLLPSRTTYCCLSFAAAISLDLLETAELPIIGAAYNSLRSCRRTKRSKKSIGAISFSASPTRFCSIADIPRFSRSGSSMHMIHSKSSLLQERRDRN
jgi:hypothetical protein